MLAQTVACPCSGEEHLDARDHIGRTLDALHALKHSAFTIHSLTGEEEAAFDKVTILLRARASALQQHAYEVHGIERMAR
jgi:hypothetical protein